MIRMDLEIIRDYSLRLSNTAELLRENIMRNKALLNEIYDDEKIAMFEKSIEVKEQLEETISTLEKNVERLEELNAFLKNSTNELEDILKNQENDMGELIDYMSSVASNIIASASTNVSEVENFIENGKVDTPSSVIEGVSEKLDYVNIASVSDDATGTFEVTNVKPM